MKNCQIYFCVPLSKYQKIHWRDIFKYYLNLLYHEYHYQNVRGEKEENLYLKGINSKSRINIAI